MRATFQYLAGRRFPTLGLMFLIRQKYGKISQQFRLHWVSGESVRQLLKKNNYG